MTNLQTAYEENHVPGRQLAHINSLTYPPKTMDSPISSINSPVKHPLAHW